MKLKKRVAVCAAWWQKYFEPAVLFQGCSGAIHLIALELLIDRMLRRLIQGFWMKRKQLQNICMTMLVLLMPVSAYAINLEEAARQAAKQNDAKVLSARTIQQGDSRVHEIKLLTRKGVVKTVRVSDKSKKKKR
jgi:phosphoribosyl-dephospho-CoA transferase